MLINKEKNVYPKIIQNCKYILIFLYIFLIFSFRLKIKSKPKFVNQKNTKKNKNLEKYIDFDKCEISIIVNMKNLNKNKHFLFYEIMQKLNSTRNFYFIKTLIKSLNENLNKFVENSSVKIVQSNFPDSIFLPLVLSLYGENVPKLILFIEGEELMDNSKNYLIKWINNAYKKIMRNGYDYIFGNSQIIEGKKIGCSILFSRVSIIEHLLYYTDSDTSHANPFIQLSLATQPKFCFIPFNYIKS